MNKYITSYSGKQPFCYSSVRLLHNFKYVEHRADMHKMICHWKDTKIAEWYRFCASSKVFVDAMLILLQGETEHLCMMCVCVCAKAYVCMERFMVQSHSHAIHNCSRPYQF
jgi:hypothetical protein